MKTINLKGRTIKVYDSIDEMPIVNFQKYNKFLLIDSGIGSDVDDIDAHIIKIAKHINSGNREKAMQELQNMRKNMYMVNSEISPKYLAFASIIHSIDGKEVIDLSDESLKNILLEINSMKHSNMVEILAWIKKKVSNELDIYFPASFTNPKEKDTYDKIKLRTLFILESVINEVDNSDKIKSVDTTLFNMYSPKNFDGSESVEVKYDKQFESMCLLISQKVNVDAKRMTVLQFYNAIEMIKQQAEAESKSLKLNKK